MKANKWFSWLGTSNRHWHLLIGYELQSKLAEQEQSLYFHFKEGDGIGFVCNGTAYSVDFKGNVTATKNLDNVVYIEELDYDKKHPITSENELKVGHTYVAFSNINSDFDNTFKVIDHTLFGKEIMLVDENHGIYTSPAFSVEEMRNYDIYEVVVPKKDE